MSRKPQPEATHGSQYWLQQLVNKHPNSLDDALRGAGIVSSGETVTWLSPLASKAYREYRDKEFLRQLGVELPKRPLAEFWPKRGSVWDGLARTSTDKLILVEAKAHIDELVSKPTRAGEVSSPLIRKSLAEAKAYYRSRSPHDWSGQFYQYTNRLAHLYLLRQCNDLPAYLPMLYFVNANDVNGPKTIDEWRGALHLLHKILGLGRNPLSPYVKDVFVDVAPFGHGPAS